MVRSSWGVEIYLEDDRQQMQSVFTKQVTYFELSEAEKISTACFWPLKFLPEVCQVPDGIGEEVAA